MSDPYRTPGGTPSSTPSGHRRAFWFGLGVSVGAGLVALIALGGIALVRWGTREAPDPSIAARVYLRTMYPGTQARVSCRRYSDAISCDVIVGDRRILLHCNLDPEEGCDEQDRH